MSAETSCRSERLANRFVHYLFLEYKASQHVRRVATWIGFLLKGIERVSDGRMTINRVRQIDFVYKGHRFRASFRHKIRAGFSRGGIEIAEIIKGRGNPKGSVVLTVTNLDEAEEAYLSLDEQLEAFIKPEQQCTLFE